MRNTVQKAKRLVDTASLFFANIAAVILLVLVVLTCIDVIGRYFFSSPLIGAVELVRLCMAGIIFFSFPVMFLRNDHIIVDLIPLFRGGWTGWITAVVTLTLTILVAWKVGDRVFDYALRAMEDNDMTEYLHIPRWPIVGFITLSIWLAAFCAFVRLLSIMMSPGILPDEHHEEGI